METLVDYNEHNNAQLSNEKLQHAISKVMVETEAQERNIIPDVHNVTMDILCQYPVTTNTQEENANGILTSEKINNSDALTEFLRGSTINDNGYYNSDENEAEDDPASYPKVATHTSDGKKIKVTDNINVNL